MMEHSPYSIRPYVGADRTACLAIFDSNTPDFFAITERSEFASFLDGSTARMLVVERREGADIKSDPAPELIACGGYYRREDTGEGALTWGMVARGWHRRGVGRILLRARLNALWRSGANFTTLRTSQYSVGFYQHEGFETMRTVANGFAPGIDLIELCLRIPFRN